MRSLSINKLVVIVLVAAIVYVVWPNMVLIDTNNQTFAAFMGAGVAYLLFQLNEFFKKIYERRIKHLNATAKLEMNFHDIGAVLNDNRFTYISIEEAVNQGNVS